MLWMTRGSRIVFLSASPRSVDTQIHGVLGRASTKSSFIISMSAFCKVIATKMLRACWDIPLPKSPSIDCGDLIPGFLHPCHFPFPFLPPPYLGLCLPPPWLDFACFLYRSAIIKLRHHSCTFILLIWQTQRRVVLWETALNILIWWGCVKQNVILIIVCLNLWWDKREIWGSGRGREAKGIVFLRKEEGLKWMRERETLRKYVYYLKWVWGGSGDL